MGTDILIATFPEKPGAPPLPLSLDVSALKRSTLGVRYVSPISSNGLDVGCAGAHVNVQVVGVTATWRR
jgi:hypothetical protein